MGLMNKGWYDTISHMEAGVRELSVAVALLILTIPGLSFAGSGRDAVRALMRVEARCEAGISYRDFSPAVGEAKFEVNLFLQSEESKKNAKLTESVNRVMAHYMAANSIWSAKFRSYPRVTGGSVKVEKGSLAESFIRQYPEVDTGGAMSSKRIVREWPGTKDSPPSKELFIMGAVGYATARASEELKSASSLVPNSSP